jgi:glycine C-acetyltransferase
MQNLEKELERATKLASETGGGILVITEGVFGMAGDLGNLKAIVDLKKKFSFRLLVDDAHGFGTMGKNGTGTGEHFGVQDEIDLYLAHCKIYGRNWCLCGRRRMLSISSL